MLVDEVTGQCVPRVVCSLHGRYASRHAPGFALPHRLHVVAPTGRSIGGCVYLGINVECCPVTDETIIRPDALEVNKG